MTCDYLISADILGMDCVNMSVKGAESVGLIINREQIDLANVEYQEDNDIIVTALPLVSGAKAYKVVQPKTQAFNGTKTEMVAGTYVNTHTKTVQVVVLKHGVKTARMIDEITNGEFVVLIQNKKTETNAPKWEAFGLETGAHCASNVRELYNDDTLAGWLITLEEVSASHSAIFVDDDVIEALVPTGWLNAEGALNPAH